MDKPKTWTLTRSEWSGEEYVAEGPDLEGDTEVVSLADFEASKARMEEQDRRLALYALNLLKENIALKADRDRLLEVLDLADTLLSTPEQHQDDEWYEQRKQVYEALASRSTKPLETKV